jgi:hypothetical protein
MLSLKPFLSLLLWLISCGSFALAQEGDSKDSSYQSLQTLDCTVLDKDGAPIEGALIFECLDYQRLLDPTTPKSQPLATTDHLGHFTIRGTCDSWEGLTVFVVADGKVVDLLNAEYIGHRPLTVRMKDESKIDVLVYDEKGAPLSGVKVTPRVLDFKGAFWTHTLSATVADRLQSLTDASGRVTLRGTDARSLESIQVDRGELGRRTFVLPREWDHASPIVLHWTFMAH